MKAILPPLTTLLLLFSSVVLLLPGRALSSDCPRDCTCSTPNSIFCFPRRSAAMPRGVPPATTELYLFSNGIEGLAPDDFHGLEKLHMLDLSQNKLTDLPTRVFEPLSSLKNLDLSSNQIGRISEHSFQGLAQLERLYLYSNHIKHIHPGAFQGLTQLLELKLQGNQLTALPALSMPRLLLLDLRFNVLPTLGPADLQTPNLESLKLAGVGLTGLDEELMASLGNLHELDVSGNQLEVFPPALRVARGLIHLSLASNPMRALAVEDLQSLGELQELDISSLSLQGLPQGFPQLFPHLQRLTVAENPFNCLCTLAWFPAWLRSQDITLTRTEETRCHFPPLNAGKVLERLEHREFGCPTTTTVTASTVRTTTTTTAPAADTTTTAAAATTTTTTTRVIQASKPSDGPSSGREGPALPPVPPTPSANPEAEQNFCPSHTCLNGGTCQLDQRGQVACVCPPGTFGAFCENRRRDGPPGGRVYSTTAAGDAPHIHWRQVTATSILLDLHRYIQARPYIRGIRLTYRNLSGLDGRPMQLNVPTTYPEYTLRGLQPNSTYAVCASPLGEPSGTDSACTQARTTGQQPGSTTDARVEDEQLTTALLPCLGLLLLLALVAAAVGAVCYRRRKRAKGHLELDCEVSQLELEGVKGDADDGALPKKQPEPLLPEPAVQSGGLEYEVLLLQDHCPSNNNLSSSHRPSYF
ncbi:vasorin b [Aplochiton taeniatus]